MRALVVLAGGFGKRLRSVVSDVPKPLAPVNGNPFITHLIYNWVNQGITDFIFLLHYEAEKIQRRLDEFFNYEAFSNVRVNYLTEKTPLGTGGAVLNALDYFGLEEGFLVANADTWLESGIKELEASKLSTIIAVNVMNTERYGLLKFEENKISSFEEKLNSTGSGYINSGSYYLLSEVFEGFRVGSNFSLEQDLFPLLVSQRCLEAIKLNSNFIDIGIPEDYYKYCSWVESGKINEL